MFAIDTIVRADEMVQYVRAAMIEKARIYSIQLGGAVALKDANAVKAAQDRLRLVEKVLRTPTMLREIAEARCQENRDIAKIKRVKEAKMRQAEVTAKAARSAVKAYHAMTQVPVVSKRPRHTPPTYLEMARQQSASA